MAYAQDGRAEADKPQADTKDDAAIIAECAERLQMAIHADRGNRAAALDDLEFLKGNQWDPVIEAQRQHDQRPCLTLNKLPVFLRQVTNAQRQNVPSIKVHPVDDGDAKVAEVVQGAIRHIEYSSGADVCYDTAVNSAAAIGFGYFRLVTDYEREDSFDQCIKFARIRNPFTVYMGPHTMPDGSDQQWCIVTEKLPRAEFKAQYPDADPCDFNGITGLGDKAADWATADEVRVAEYYRIHKEPAQVVLLSDGRSGYADELDPQGAEVVNKRQGVRSVVQWFKLTANEVIDRADIPCRWIPVFPVYGDEIDINGEVYRAGLVRHAKDPARMYNFWMPLRTNTPIRTPSGWSTIADLREGDQVFADDGKPTTVVGKSPVYINRDCYRVTFGDGSFIDADAQHPWVVQERGKRSADGFQWVERKLRTDELDPRQHCIKNAGALSLPDAALPVDPYFLGVWLGDGSSAEPRITASAKDVEPIRAELLRRGLDVGAAVSYSGKAPTFTVHGVRAALTALGVRGNKHIPDAYLNASLAQRLELLRGLMDTDGTVHGVSGACMFAQADEALAEQVRELLVSLGIRVGVTRRAGRVSMLANGHAIESTGCTQLAFTPPAGMSVFSLPRKAAVQTRERPRHARRSWHKIVSVERIPSVPVQCIAIDAPSHLFLAGRSLVPTHNTAATEEVALRPKSPFIGAEGQFEGHEDEWELANKVSFPYLEYKPKALGGMLAPPPQRQPMADLPSGVLAMAMHAADDIKATTGIFDASLGARSNETSGVAIARRDRQGEVANFHYSDNLASTLRHCGRVILDMWPKVYDGTRTLQIMSQDGKVSSVPVNQPEVDPLTGAVQRVMNDMTVAKFAVTISVGPSFDTLRQEAVEGMVQVGQAWPKLWEVAGDKLVRTMDWPMADEIADRLKKTLPPELAQDDDEKAAEPALPPDVEAQLQQYDKALQDAMAQIDALQAGIEKERIRAQATVEAARIRAEGAADVAELSGLVKLLVAQMQPPPALAAEVGDDLGGEMGDEPGAAAQPAPNTF